MRLRDSVRADRGFVRYLARNFPQALKGPRPSYEGAISLYNEAFEGADLLTSLRTAIQDGHSPFLETGIGVAHASSIDWNSHTIHFDQKWIDELGSSRRKRTRAHTQAGEIVDYGEAVLLGLLCAWLVGLKPVNSGGFSNKLGRDVDKGGCEFRTIVFGTKDFCGF